MEAEARSGDKSEREDPALGVSAPEHKEPGEVTQSEHILDFSEKFSNLEEEEQQRDCLSSFDFLKMLHRPVNKNNGAGLRRMLQGAVDCYPKLIRWLDKKQESCYQDNLCLSLVRVGKFRGCLTHWFHLTGPWAPHL